MSESSETRYYDAANLLWYRQRNGMWYYAHGTLKGINPVRGWFGSQEDFWIESRISDCMKLRVTTTDP